MQVRAMLNVVTVGLLCLAAAALAQQPGQGQQGQRGRGGPPGGGFGMFGGGGGGMSRLFLLRIPDVQKELELADEQVLAIQKVQEELGAGRGRGGAPGGQGGDGKGRGTRGKGNNNNNNGAALERPADWYFVQAQAQPGQGRGGRGGPQTPEERAASDQQRLERERQEKAKLAEILLPHQLKRLNEIYVQRAGVNALQDEDVAKQLAISDAQRQQMTKVRDDYRAKRSELFQGGGGGGDQEARMAKFAEMRKAEDEQILGLLSAQQKTKFDELKGKPFEMPEDAIRNAFGGRGGPGGGQKGGQKGRGNNNN